METTSSPADAAAQGAVTAFAFAAEAAGYDLAALGEAMMHAGMIVMKRALGTEQAAFTGMVIARAALVDEVNAR